MAEEIEPGGAPRFEVAQREGPRHGFEGRVASSIRYQRHRQVMRAATLLLGGLTIAAGTGALGFLLGSRRDTPPPPPSELAVVVAPSSSPAPVPAPPREARPRKHRPRHKHSAQRGHHSRRHRTRRKHREIIVAAAPAQHHTSAAPAPAPPAAPAKKDGRRQRHHHRHKKAAAKKKPAPPPEPTLLLLHMINPDTWQHFYTSDREEASAKEEQGFRPYKYEGYIFGSEEDDTVPIVIAGRLLGYAYAQDQGDHTDPLYRVVWPGKKQKPDRFTHDERLRAQWEDKGWVTREVVGYTDTWKS